MPLTILPEKKEDRSAKLVKRKVWEKIEFPVARDPSTKVQLPMLLVAALIILNTRRIYIEDIALRVP